MGRPAVCRLACSRNNACEILWVCSLNNIEQAYRVIGKHIYTACLRCRGDKIIVIIANTTSEAEEKTKREFTKVLKEKTEAFLRENGLE